MLDVKIEGFAHKFALTGRERQVLSQLIGGNTSSAQISEALGISENTVRIHVKNINSRVYNLQGGSSFLFRSIHRLLTD